MNKKIVSIILVIVLVLLLFLVPQNNSDQTTGAFTLSFAGEAATRIFSSPMTPDTNLTVILSVELDENTSIYGIDETFPSEFTLANAGSGTSDGNNGIMWFYFEATPGTTINLEYILTAPQVEGTYTFSGEYQLEEDENPSTIGGITSVTVSTTPAPACTNGEEKCEGQIPFVCDINSWTSQGLINGKCGYTSGGGGNGGSGGTGGGGTVIIPTDNNDEDQNTPNINPKINEYCGDTKCNNNENCNSCWIDCGKCNIEPGDDINLGNIIAPIIDIEKVGEAGKQPINYAYLLLGLGTIAGIYAIFRLLRIKKGKPPSTIDWEKISIGIKNV